MPHDDYPEHPTETRTSEKYQRAFVCSGHMIDAPGRSEPRFPPEKEAAVRELIERQLDIWNAGPGDLAISGAARGADILFAEACRKRGMHLRLLIALVEAEYLEQSVQLPGDPSWKKRYEDLIETSLVWYMPEHPEAPAPELDPFSRANLWMLETARRLVPPEQIHAILVWDEKLTSDGPGGTSHFAEEVGKLGGKVKIINPIEL